MMPNPSNIGDRVGGIQTVVRAYSEILPPHGIDLVHPDAEEDLVVRHAGMGGGACDVAMLHGIYFTADYRASKFEYRANKHVINSIRHATMVTVPSEWVAETLRREFRIDPVVLPHGIFPDEWRHSKDYRPKSVLWAKNRFYDVCDPTPLNAVAEELPDYTFFSTVVADGAPDNVVEIGIQPTEQIKDWIQQVSMVISTVKETWGIMYAEALAAGTPVVAADIGHVPNLVEHGVSGYVYSSRNLDDVIYGIKYVEQNRSQLSANASRLAGELAWSKQAGRIARALKLAHKMKLAGLRM
jgi:glycosyltransferase involved in cell wall biosynthesis